MPLLRISKELFSDLADKNLIQEVKALFTTFEYLGSTDEYSLPQNTYTYLVSAKGLEPGEYFVDVLVTVKPDPYSSTNSCKYTFSIKNRK